MSLQRGNKNMNVYIYTYKRYIIFHLFKTTSAGPERPENTPSLMKHTPALRLPSHTSETSLDRQKHDRNKAEHGCNIGMHAVNKHPVNMLRLNNS